MKASNLLLILSGTAKFINKYLLLWKTTLCFCHKLKLVQTHTQLFDSSRRCSECNVSLNIPIVSWTVCIFHCHTSSVRCLVIWSLLCGKLLFLSTASQSFYLRSQCSLLLVFQYSISYWRYNSNMNNFWFQIIRHYQNNFSNGIWFKMSIKSLSFKPTHSPAGVLPSSPSESTNIQKSPLVQSDIFLCAWN